MTYIDCHSKSLVICKLIINLQKEKTVECNRFWKDNYYLFISEQTHGAVSLNLPLCDKMLSFHLSQATSSVSFKQLTTCYSCVTPISIYK